MYSTRQCRSSGRTSDETPSTASPGYGDYAVADAHITTASYEWTHTLGDIVTALAGAGLRIEYLHEHPFADWQFIKSMQRSDDGNFRFTDGAALPLMYSIKATR
jgi:hypothetical protein